MHTLLGYSKLTFTFSVLCYFLLVSVAELYGQENFDLDADAKEVASKLDEESGSVSKSKLVKILLSGGENELDAEKLYELDLLETHPELRLPIFRLLSALAVKENVIDKSRRIAIRKLFDFSLQYEELRDAAMSCILKTKKSHPGFALEIDAHLRQHSRVLKRKSYDQINYRLFAFAESDPLTHPKLQSEAERKLTLENQILAAIGMLEENKDQQFLEAFYDPYDHIDGRPNIINENVSDFRSNVLDGMGRTKILDEMKRQLSDGLVWALQGRMAWVKIRNKKRRPRTTWGAWVFRENRWYYSFLRNKGRGLKPTKAIPVRFFENKTNLPTFDITKVGERERLQALRSTQQKSFGFSQVKVFSSIAFGSSFSNDLWRHCGWVSVCKYHGARCVASTLERLRSYARSFDILGKIVGRAIDA